MNILLTKRSGVFKEQKGFKTYFRNQEGGRVNPRSVGAIEVSGRLKGRWYFYTMIGDMPSVVPCTATENKEYDKEFNL